VIFNNNTYREEMIVNGTHLTLQSQRIGLRGRLGEVAWTRPAAVWVERDGVPRWEPILDVTRIITLTLWCLSLAFTIVRVGTFHKRRIKSG
jgi:hypothetical protein